MRTDFPFTPAHNISPLRIDRMYGKVTLPRNVDGRDGRAEGEDAHPPATTLASRCCRVTDRMILPLPLLNRDLQAVARGRCRFQTLQSCDDGLEPHSPRTG
jgi:hypothetical protein